MKILLDTNFILTCTKQKIDFYYLTDKLFDEKIEWIVPSQVIRELENIKNKKEGRKKEKDFANISIDILSTINYTVVNLEDNPNVDIAIVNYIKDKDIVLATLDRNLKRRVKNKILTIRNEKTLELIQ